MHQYCPKLSARWNNRSKHLMKEIITSNADVVCLQECDFYHEFWKNELLKNGYESIMRFQPKGDKSGFMPYGTAIAYKKDKYVV